MSKRFSKPEINAWTVLLNLGVWFGFLALVDFFFDMGWPLYVLLGPVMPVMLIMAWAYSLDDWEINETKVEQRFKRLIKMMKKEGK